MLVATGAAMGVMAPAASAGERVAVNGRWQSIVNCAFTSYDPLTGSMSCVGSTLWTGGLRGLTAYKVTGTYDLLTGDSHGSLHETFHGRDDRGDHGTITFDEQFEIDGATSAIRIDAVATGGTGGFAGVRGTMTFDGTDTVATRVGSYAAVLELREAAR
jgi:hypothetical protein